MSAYQSYLASGSYGYDFVVATTQASINDTLKLFLYEVGEPLVTVCYVTGPGGVPQQIGYDELISLAHGSDPFAVSPDAEPRTDPDLFNLAKAGFMAGFRAQIGIPPVSDASKIATLPDMVTLGSSASSVTFSLLCSEFDVTQLGASGSSWLSASQPVDNPWVFTAAVDLRLADVPGDAFHTLPDAVQQQIKNLSGSAFSIQQLLFDLDNARLMSVPQITGVEGTALDKLLREYFTGMYFGQMKVSGQPLLGVTVTQQTESASTLAPTDMNIGVSPYVGAAEPDLSCLTYLCATDGHRLPAPAAFGWNWVDHNETTFDGAIAVSRAALVQLLLKQMLPMVQANCYQPYVRVTLDTASQPVYDIRPIGGQMPQIDTSCADEVIVPYNPSHPPHFQIMRFKYDASASDAAGAFGGDIGKASMDSHYLAAVSTSGNTLTITQTLTINLSITKHLQTTSGTPVNVVRMDTCTLDVDDFGQLAANMSTPILPVNKPTEQDVNSFLEFWTGVNAQYGNTEAIVKGVSGTLVNAIPFGTMQCFVFPGGQTFSYKSVTFSQHADLVSHLVYADPDQAPPGPILPAGQVAGSEHLNAGQWIPNDGFLISGNKKYAAYLQDDGNFVLLYCTNGEPDLGRPFWSWAANKPALKVGPFTGTPCFATMQADGNFVLYHGTGPLDARQPYWATGTTQQGLGKFFAVMQDDRNFVVYSGTPQANTGVLFATSTNI